MALIPCPECGRMISPNAVECPACGAPVKELLTCITLVEPVEQSCPTNTILEQFSINEEERLTQNIGDVPQDIFLQKKKKVLIWSFIAIIVVLLAVLTFILLRDDTVCHQTFTTHTIEKNDVKSKALSTSNAIINHAEHVEEPYELNSRLLTENDLLGKSKFDLRIMRNEIYARHGYLFKSSDLQEYFSQKPWYRGTTYDAGEIMFNDIEKKNIEFIKNHEF